MDHSCQCKGIELEFDRAVASKQLDEYRRKGPKETTLALIEALKAEGVQGLTLLDIGGGTGDIQHALLRSGVRTAIDVEASTAYLETCRAEAERQGHAERIRHLQGDFVALAEEIPPAGIVTLDRVVCCYDDMTRLVSLSANKAMKLYGLVYPRDELWIKLLKLVIYDLPFRLRRSPFRVFVHPCAEVEALIRARGLEPRFARKMGVWHVLVFARPVHRSD